MSYLNDPRVLFATERTLLAWNRTAIGLMGFGFLVERFGLFLRVVVGHAQGPLHQQASLVIGVAVKGDPRPAGSRPDRSDTC